MSETNILPNHPNEILKGDHLCVRELFDQYDALGREENQRKRRLFFEIQQVLILHMDIEELLFYPAIRNSEGEGVIRVTNEALRVHDQVKTLLRELSDLYAANRSLDAKMKTLQLSLLSHYDMEESTVFPHSQVLEPKTLHELSSDMEDLRDRFLRIQKREGYRQQEPLTSDLRDTDDAHDEDREISRSLESGVEFNERHRNGYENWGSE